VFGYLLSYHYYRATDLDALAEAAGAPDLTFFADSGAFSAEHAGAQISIADYAGWLKRWAHRIHAYASLDVLHEPVASQRNYDALKDLGLDPLPVFHVGEPLEFYDRCLELGPYMAIGGMVRSSLGMRSAKFWRYLSKLHDQAQASEVKLHGFGLCSWPVIRQFPWHSVDSSEASSGFRYGRVTCYDPYADTWRAWHLRDRQAWGRWGWLAREYEMTPTDFGGSNVEAREALITIAARSWAVAARRCEVEVYQAPHLSAAGIKSKNPAQAPTGRDVIAAYQRANDWEGEASGTTLYVAEAYTSQEGRRGSNWHFARWQDGVRWERARRDSSPGALSGPLPASEALGR
jgi:hypothetical protein